MTLKFSTMEFTYVNRFEDLEGEDAALVQHASQATLHAYAPYSNFHVGAAVLLEDDSIVTGSNQENASYPLCMCAERVVLYTVATQYPGKTIRKMAVVAKRAHDDNLTPVTCCGACRQVMLEFENRQRKPMEVIMQHQDHQWVKAASAASLLPLGFTKECL